jgi:hypothetical protein
MEAINYIVEEDISRAHINKLLKNDLDKQILSIIEGNPDRFLKVCKSQITQTPIVNSEYIKFTQSAKILEYELPPYLARGKRTEMKLLEEACLKDIIEQFKNQTEQYI